MPTVPLYKPNQVQQAGVPNVRVPVDAPIEAFGGGQSAQQVTNAAVSSLGTIEKIALEEKKAADQTVFISMDRRLSELQTKLQIDSSKMEGWDAGDAPNFAQEAWNKGIEEIGKDASNDVQRMAFQRSAGNRWESLNKSVQIHVADQINKVQDSETTSYLAASRDAAKLNAFDDQQISLELDRQHAVLTEWAQRNGVYYNKDKTGVSNIFKTKLAEEVSLTHREIVNSRLNAGKVESAKGYFEAVKERGELTAKDLGSLEANLKEGVLRAESQKNATVIMDKYAGNMKGALEAARDISDPDVQEATVREVKTRFAENENIERDRNERLFQNAADISKQTLKRPPEQLWNQLSIKDQVALDNHIKQLRSGDQIAPNGEEFYYLKTLASTRETQEEFIKTPLRSFIDKVTPTELNELIDIQTKLRSDRGKADKELDGYRTNQMIVNDTLNSIGIDPTPKPGKADAEKVANFRRLVDEEIVKIQQQQGKPATNEQVQNIVDQLTTKVVTHKGFLWDSTKRAYQLEPGEEFVEVKDVPRGERAKIEEALRRRNLPVTDESVMTLYTTKLKGGTFKK